MCRVWSQLLRYGLGTEQYVDLYPLLVRQLLYFVDKVDIVQQTEAERQFDLDVGSSIFSLLTCVLGTADEKILGRIMKRECNLIQFFSPLSSYSMLFEQFFSVITRPD